MSDIRSWFVYRKAAKRIFAAFVMCLSAAGTVMAADDSVPRLVYPGPAPEAPLSRVADGATQFMPSMPDEFVPGEMLIKFKARVSPDDIELSPIKNEFDAELKHTHKLIGVHLFKLKKAMSKDATVKAIEKFKKHQLVEFAEPNGIVQAIPELGEASPTAFTLGTEIATNDPRLGEQYGLGHISAFTAWNLSKGDPASYVAIVDSGVNWNHPDLAGKVDIPAEQLGNCISPGIEPMDDKGHGTAVAGVAAAAGNNGIGIAGVAFNQRILAVKVVDAALNGTLDTTICGINIAAAIPEVKVINLSLGWVGGSSALYDAVYNAWVNYGKTIVAANGNFGSSSPYYYPACYSLNGIAISVGATDSYKRRWFLSSANECITVSAPGASILSAYSTNYDTGNYYAAYSGTSLASPHVAGTVALMQAYRSRSNTAVRDNLISTALALGSDWNVNFGYGIINAHKAVRGVQLAAGFYHTVSLRSDGALWAWGNNDYGQLGNGEIMVDKTSPVRIGTDTQWVALSAGWGHTVAQKADGTLWAWGLNYYGQLGDGTAVDKSTPVQIGTDATWVKIETGDYHTAALKADGTLWTWGSNYYGQLGNGTKINKISPIQIGTDTSWVAVSAGKAHTAALKADGTLWAWGYNAAGQLGDGTMVNKLAPVRIGADTTWAAVKAGSAHTVALKSDGSLWAWGYNGYGQLGDGTIVNKLSPIRIGTDAAWVSMAAGRYHTAALKADGTLWAWGSNSFGQLGDGTTAGRTSPIQVGTDATWVAVDTGSVHTMALKSDDTLWAWGENSHGQLGDGTTVNASMPVLVVIP